MTENEFVQACSLQQTGSAVTIDYEKFNMTGKLIGCWNEYLVVDVDGKQTLWPGKLCKVQKHNYIPPALA